MRASPKASWINGSFDERISPFDEGFLLGHGAFETIGVFDGRMPLWDAHLNRLQDGAAALGIPFDIPDELAVHAVELLRRGPGDDILRLTLTAGPEGRPTWCMTTRRRTSDPRPMHLVVSDLRRSDGDPLAAVKCTSYTFLTMARRRAQAVGADDALLIGEGGKILETTTGNVFFQRLDVIRIPRTDGSILPGVGRRALIASLEDMGVTVEQTDCTLSDVDAGDAIFTTNAVYGPRAAAMLPGDAVRVDPVVDPVVVAAWTRAVS